MPHSKADQFDTNLFNFSTWNKVRSHPARLVILEHILHNGPSPFYQLNQIINLHPSTVSQHIDYLIEYDFIVIQSKYPKAMYALNETRCRLIARLLLEYEFDLIYPDDLAA